MNLYMKNALNKARIEIITLKSQIATAAAMDDGVISKEEKKQIDAIIKAADKFLKDTTM